MRILVTILMCLWMNVGYASPNWEVVDENTWVDTTSVKVMQVDYDELVKANTKANNNGGGYSLATIVVNKDTKWWAVNVMKVYDTNGRLFHKSTHDIRDKYWWIDGTNNNLVDAIINRVP